MKYIDPDGRAVIVIPIAVGIAKIVASGAAAAAITIVICEGSKAIAETIHHIANQIEKNKENADKQKAPPANEGRGGKHGNTDHNDAIDKKVQDLLDAGYDDVRKNQQQVDADGNKVGTNRPDVQGTNPATKKREYWEFDHNARSSQRHGDQIHRNDPSGEINLELLK